MIAARILYPQHTVDPVERKVNGKRKSDHARDLMISARAAGFKVMRRGSGSLNTWLAANCISKQERRRRFAKVLGPIHTWLSSSRLAPEYGPIRDLVADIVVAKYVVRPETAGLGRQVANLHQLPIGYFAGPHATYDI